MKATAKRRGRPKKSSEDTLSESVLLPMQPREKEAFTNASDLAGVPLSAWMRERLRLAAREELDRVGQKAAFIE